jgi:hypothetical protein
VLKQEINTANWVEKARWVVEQVPVSSTLNNMGALAQWATTNTDSIVYQSNPAKST